MTKGTEKEIPPCHPAGYKILIVGNGFDLYHKLPTRYMDFLFFARHWGEFKKEYDQRSAEKQETAAGPMEIRLNADGRLISESLLDFAGYSGRYSPEHIEFLDRELEDNAWLKYFGKISIPGKNWVDFEREIEKALRQVELYYHRFLPEMNNEVPIKKMPDSMKKVIKTFSPAAREPYRDLSASIFLRKDIDPEYLGPNKEQLVAAMKEELDLLNRCLGYYLGEFVSGIRCSVYSEQIKALGNIYLLNFNYTYTYARVYGEGTVVQHHPVHGEAERGNIVLGIPDESFDDTLDYVYFQKYFQRIQKRTGNLYREWTGTAQGQEAKEQPADVYIMGHSLSTVDKGILKNFFFGRNTGRITIFYQSQSCYESQVIHLVEMFGKDFVIEQTAAGRIVFEPLQPARRISREESMKKED